MVLATLANITTNDLIPDWVEIRDWVSKNINYTLDSEVHATEEYWQYPNETLTLGTGDCEDFSILLCSLLRANGWDENEAYVVIGVKDGQYHGWVKLNVDLIGWQSIEPQADALNTLVGDTLTLSGFTAEYMFNDQNFQTT
jgi:transglutaminase-like putative cysteine protease